MRLLLLCVVLLTATSNQVSAQDSHLPRYKTVYVDMREDPPKPNQWKAIPGKRQWVANPDGSGQWWIKVKRDDGPGWGLFAGQQYWFETRVTEQWVRQATPSQLKTSNVIRHTTVNVWALRDQAMKELEAKQREQGTLQKRLYEPVYRVPNPRRSQQEFQPIRESNQGDSDDGWKSSSKPENENRKAPRRSQPSGPSVYVSNQ